MSAPALAGADGPTLRIRGTSYPVLLPSVRDPRLHLAAVIVSLQVLGQVAFDFRLSIAQILVSLLTAAALEVAIAFRRRRVLMWPASALLTGNGVAFVLRVPGTEHGDWWSLHGAWIFAATSAVALLSKHVVRFRGGHVFNPSNIGLVLAFLLLGAGRADPLALWWGPLSPSLVLALAIIVAGGFAILGRLRLLELAVGFWLAFAAGTGVLAVSGHEMTAPWHLEPIAGAQFWWTLVSSPEILVFLFFMLTDPRTVPASPGGRRAFAVGVGLLATLLIAPHTSEFATKVAVLGALALACAARPLLLLLRGTPVGALASRAAPSRPAAAAAALAAAAAFSALVVVAGAPARPGPATAAPAAAGALPPVTVVQTEGLAALDRPAAARIARDLVAALRLEADALRRRDRGRAATAAGGAWLVELWRRIGEGARGPLVVPTYDVDGVRLALRPSGGQSPPTVVADLTGTMRATTYEGSPPRARVRTEPAAFRRTVELALARGRYVLVGSRDGAGAAALRPAPAGDLGGVRLQDVAAAAGLRFRHGAFRFGMSGDPTAMMGGGVCWLDYDRDGWLDLFAVNSYGDRDYARWEARGGLPSSALFRNVRGRFEDVSRRSGAGLRLRGNGCTAADLNGDGYTDLYVTSAGYNVPTDGYDALLWNNGDGTFTEGARAAGIDAPGWHSGAAVGDVDGDGRPDLFVAGYTDVNAPLPSSTAGFPATHRAEADRLYLNQGPDASGRSTFREVSRLAGIERAGLDHGLGAVLSDLDRDGRLDLFVAGDGDPNRLYRNVAWPGGAAADPAGLGFRLEEVGRRAGVDDRNAGMGIAAADVSGDGRTDLLVTNSRGQLHGAYRSRGRGALAFADARAGIAPALGASATGWGASWLDADLDGALDLVVANGAIPITNLARDAERIQVLANRSRPNGALQLVDAGVAAGIGRVAPVNGRGLAAADYDNDGDLDVAVNSIGGPLLLLRSTGAGGHWLEVELRPFSPGAVVTAVLPDGRRLVREVLAGSSYLSSEDPRVHFGLGEATSVSELVVRYPGGRVTRRSDVAADRLLVLGPSGR